MNPRDDRQRLLAEVLAEGGATRFREALLTQTLRQVRQRRRVRRAWRAAGAATLGIALAALVWRSLVPANIAPQTGGPGRPVVVSRPLAPAALVLTEPLAPSRIIVSAPSTLVVRVATGGSKVREIGDGELLALLAPKPAALVRRGAQQVELVFANEADEKELLRN
jgi:hypothetical protein